MSLILDVPASLRDDPGFAMVIGHLVPEPPELAAMGLAILGHELLPGATLEAREELGLAGAGRPLRGLSATVRDAAGVVVEERMIVFFELTGGVTAVRMAGPALGERRDEVVAMLASGRQGWDDDVASLAGLLAGFTTEQARSREQAADPYCE